MSVFGETLRKIRTRKNLRQKDLAQALGLTQATIANYEQGIRFPDERVLNHLADQLAVSVDELLGRSKALAPPPRPDFDVDQVIRWLLDGSFAPFQAWIDERLETDLSVAQLYAEVLQPVLYEVGHRWEAGTLDVYEEHAISEQLKRHMAVVVSRYPRNDQGPRLLSFIVSGELHEMGMKMVTDLFHVSGWNTLYLGVNLPMNSILSAIETWKPQLVGISANLERHLPAVQQTIYFLRNELKEACPPILVGGPAFKDDAGLARSLGADLFSRGGLEAVETANVALQFKRINVS